ncbi:MAG: hypothetical protein KDC38_02275 [Planctomycetes bacterium]|nr:hypothetical protein [Planctomycetota bacterium]
MTRVLILLLSTSWAAAVLGGCASPTPKASPAPFYGNWDHLSADDRAALDAARERAESQEESVPYLLEYARRLAALARHESQTWFSVQESPTRDPALQRRRVAAARRRLLDACRHALGVYHEVELLGGSLEPRDRLLNVWLWVFSDDDEKAELLLKGLESDPEFPPELREAVRTLRAEITPEEEPDAAQ